MALNGHDGIFYSLKEGSMTYEQNRGTQPDEGGQEKAGIDKLEFAYIRKSAPLKTREKSLNESKPV